MKTKDLVEKFQEICIKHDTRLTWKPFNLGFSLSPWTLALTSQLISSVQYKPQTYHIMFTFKKKYSNFLTLILFKNCIKHKFFKTSRAHLKHQYILLFIQFICGCECEWSSMTVLSNLGSGCDNGREWYVVYVWASPNLEQWMERRARRQPAARELCSCARPPLHSSLAIDRPRSRRSSFIILDRCADAHPRTRRNNRRSQLFRPTRPP